MPRHPSRRSLLQGAAAAGGIGSLARPGRLAAASGGVFLSDLRVDHLTTPLAIEGTAPRLSWLLNGPAPLAYRVVVASTPERLAAGRADLWDSGDLHDRPAFDVAYGGRPLASLDEAHWLVEAVSPGNVRTRSAPSRWRMGLLRPQDWTGDWLAAESEDVAQDRAAGLEWIWGSTGTTSDRQLLRRRFDVCMPGAGSVLQVVARDQIDGIWLNGEPLARPERRPGPVNNARMETIALPLVAGTNEIVVAASHHPERSPPTPTGGMAAVIRIHDADGAVHRLTTRRDWMVAERPGSAIAAPEGSWSAARAAGSAPRNDPWAAGPAMLMRRRFRAGGGVVRATLYATALGAYYAHLNGTRVSDALLAPESTDFRRRALYQAYDVTGLLRRGDNMLAAIVGDGWYGSTALFGGRYDLGPAPCRFRAQLLIERGDGSRQIVATDRHWRAAASGTLAAEIYDGEVHDARLRTARWDEPDSSDAGWTPARPAPAPGIAVTAQPDAPIRVIRTLQPVSITTIGPGVHVFDFGQNAAGRCRVTARAEAGTTITLRHAEILKADGDVDQTNLRSALARDVYVFAGGDRETWAPDFTYHGFRYVRVEGWPDSPPPGFLVFEVIGTALRETGTFRIDDPLVSKLWLNALWSQRSNFVGLPTDCPQRDERFGWMGDAQVFWDAACFNMDTAAFTRRFMGDVRDGQDADGVFADFNPQSPLAGLKGSPGWGDAGVLLPWTAWRRYGDTAIIDENWRAMSAWAEHVHRSNPDLVWRNARGVDYGDWLALDAKQPGDPTTPKDLVATAMWARTTRCLADMAEATGRLENAEGLRARHHGIVGAFRSSFVGPDGRVGNGSQTGYLLALHDRLVPDELRSSAAVALTQDIRRRGGVLSTGFLGTPIALDVLLDLGRRDLVLSLLRRTAFPSWGYMVARGATTMWERWNGDTGDVAMNSFDHYALGAIASFMYRRLAGIDAAAPGFARALIAPDPWIGFGSAGATYDSVAGRFETAWTRRGDAVRLDVSIPSGAAGMLRLPAGPSRAAKLDGRRLTASAGIYEAELAPGRHRIEMGETDA